MSIPRSKPELPDPWPFDQSPRCAVFTTTHIMKAGEPIVFVFHDEEDHGWQFHWAGEKSMDDMMLVALEEVFYRDPTIIQIADLPPGWCASRSEVGADWIRWKDESEPDLES